MKILITGGNGQLAYDLKTLAQQKNYHVYAPDRYALDITEPDKVMQVITGFQPDVVINTAAYTLVDRAEEEMTSAFLVNRDGAQFVAEACQAIQALLLHVSTDYVFSGDENRPLNEQDAVAPLNLYGMSKWQGEEAVRLYCERHIILRVSAVFGLHGHNFVKTILRLAKERDYLSIVDDQITCPTSAFSIAETLLALTNAATFGTFHYCGNEAMSWYDFANKILEFGSNQTPIRPLRSADYFTLAKRPRYSVLDCQKILNTFGIKRPNWELDLQQVIHGLLVNA